MTPSFRDQRISALHTALAQRIVILDGAMGTMIQRHKLDEAAYRGERFADWGHDLKGNNDLLVLTQPQIIHGIHTAYLEAGADIVETNSFNATRIAMADYAMEELAYELNVAAARLARPSVWILTTSSSVSMRIWFVRVSVSMNWEQRSSLRANSHSSQEQRNARTSCCSVRSP